MTQQLPPNVPLRIELVYEVPGSPEQVWAAIATGPGSTSWFLPTEIEEREGGRVVFHMPPEGASEGTVTAWDPPRRIAYEEPHWADHHDTPHTPLATEMLVEATSGGTCVIRVVSSAFGTGADWEAEFMTAMEDGWRPFFEILKLYLSRFPGQHASQHAGSASLKGSHQDVTRAIFAGLGVERVGQQVEAGTVEILRDDAVLLSMDGPVPGYFGFAIWPMEVDQTMVRLSVYAFGPDAPSAAEELGGRWQRWLEELAVTAS
jgi:uncharacterized protein YndB with AHSA1/START domain